MSKRPFIVATAAVGAFAAAYALRELLKQPRVKDWLRSLDRSYQKEQLKVDRALEQTMDGSDPVVY